MFGLSRSCVLKFLVGEGQGAGATNQKSESALDRPHSSFFVRRGDDASPGGQYG
jgi:hypothetical protein